MDLLTPTRLSFLRLSVMGSEPGTTRNFTSPSPAGRACPHRPPIRQPSRAQAGLFRVHDHCPLQGSTRHIKRRRPPFARSFIQGILRPHNFSKKRPFWAIFGEYPHKIIRFPAKSAFASHLQIWGLFASMPPYSPKYPDGPISHSSRLFLHILAHFRPKFHDC